MTLKSAQCLLCVFIDRPGLEVHERDGLAFIAERAAAVAKGSAAPADLLFLDVFDGDDQIPLAFTEPGQHPSLLHLLSTYAMSN